MDSAARNLVVLNSELDGTIEVLDYAAFSEMAWIIKAFCDVNEQVVITAIACALDSLARNT